MKISHELPLTLLHKVKEWNDYDYCLPHLLDKYELYRHFFLESRKSGRFIIMDNGLFEGVNHTNQDLLEKINLIEPDIFIVPDAWNNDRVTYNSAAFWMESMKKELPKRTNLMVVMQGTSKYTMQVLFEGCEELGYKHFAFNHSSNIYQLMNHTNKEINSMIGRINLVSSFYKHGLIKDDYYVHLLGCSLPQEFKYYHEYRIDSVDTSNPIICGALGIKYGGEGLFMKPKAKIEAFMEIDLDGEMDAIEYNVKKFRNFSL